MNLRFLLDTNVISEPLRATPSASTMKRLHEHEAEMAISVITLHELRYGALRLPPSKRRAAIERYIDSVILPAVAVLDYGRRAAEWHAEERARLSAAGRIPPFADGQIASIAAVNDLVLVTRNRSDFDGFRGLEVRRW